MGRHRSSNHDLPENVYQRGSAFYYVRRHEGIRAWVPLGRNRDLVERRLAEIKADPSIADRLRDERVLKATRKNALRDAVMSRDRYMCMYCGARTNLVIDHVIPVREGGADHIKNLVIACAQCNLEKGHTNVLDFIAMLDERRARIVEDPK